MKKTNLGSVLFLLVLAAAVIWLNFEENGSSPNSNAEKEEASYVLAVSWQSAFCEKRPNTPECRSQRKSRFDARNFSLHGLWPQPRGNSYCKVASSVVTLDKSGRWQDLPRLDLSDSVREALAQKMPGYRSHLHRHEWFKHGSCMPGYSQDEYFRFSLNLLDQLNQSQVKNLLESNIGRRIGFRELKAAFQREFGKAAAGRFVLDCYRDDGRRIIHELKLSLHGILDAEKSLADLMAAAAPAGRSCPSGVVDPVGLQ